MGLFKKLFGRKKNEIHLTAEEAFAAENPAPTAPEAPSNEPPKAEAPVQVTPPPKAMPLTSEEQAALERTLFFAAEKIEEAGSAVRDRLRAISVSISESDGRCTATLGDESVIEVVRAPLAGLAGLGDKLTANLEKAASPVLNILQGLNQRLSVKPLCRGEELDDIYERFIAAMKRLPDCYELTKDNRLLGEENRLLWDSEGNSEIGLAAGESKASEEAEKDAAKAQADEAPAPAADEAPASKSSERAARSREMIASHGISLDCSHAVAIDEEHVFPRSIKETVERISALTATAIVANAYMTAGSASPAARSAAVVNRYETLYGVKHSFTPKESAYLREPTAGKHTSNALRAEAAYALLWALGYMDLSWPDTSADLTKLGDLLKNNDFNSLCANAKPRDKEALLDMYDLTTRLHALCVRAGLRELKETGLDPDIIYERHYAFNWLLGIGGFSSWDSIIPAT